jgi:hypothetical protein
MQELVGKKEDIQRYETYCNWVTEQAQAAAFN